MPDDNKQYDAKAVEAKWRDHWVTNKTFAWNSDEDRDTSFVIDTPPPTISGFLHMGHIYSYTQTDVIARFMRMHGKNVFYPVGWDNNGLPTERLVEKEKGVRAVDMKREDFIKLCYEVVGNSVKSYRNLFQTMGLSMDWNEEYETVSADSRRLSQMSVLDLYEKGHLYRKPDAVLWDPVDQTALAQADIAEKETPGVFYEFAFKVEETGEELIIASTRPELLGACVVVMISPEHPRVNELAGKHAITPLFNVRVPIMVDDSVLLDKGTGVMMYCTFGDQTAVTLWKEHNFPLRVVLDKQGRINDMPGFGEPGWETLNPELAFATRDALKGLYVKKAKAKIAELLAEHGLLRGQRDVMRMVPCAERSGATLEIIVTPQWCIRILDKKEAILAKAREIEWLPEYMRIRLEQWTENLKWDWAISRQRFFGVPLPFWYSKRAGEEGKILVPTRDQLPVDPLVDLPAGYTRDEVEPDPDVLDTWATSSITPQLSSRGLNDKYTLDAERHAKLYPAHMRPQAHEIIRTWAFYTIVKSLLHDNSIPWEKAAISGWCLAEDRTKMSKSKGNVVRPEDFIAEHNVDTIRYWTANGRLGMDTAIDHNILKIGKRLQTKLWNAARFVSLQLKGFAPSGDTLKACEKDVTHPTDRWVASRLAETIDTVTKHHLAYDYADALRVSEEFFWKDLCDNYLELVKSRAYGETGDAAGQKSAQTTLYFVLEATLRLFAPYMPFITEELYSTLFPQRFAQVGSVHARGMWPKADEFITDAGALAEGQTITGLLAAVRKAKTMANASIKNPANRLVVVGGAQPSAASLADFCSAATVPAPEFVDTAVDGLPTVSNDEGTATIQIELAEAQKKTA
ncbi:MAG: valine--tRNA ligase [Bdellovibrionales bacterium]